jgi:hypothetical protein
LTVQLRPHKNNAWFSVVFSCEFGNKLAGDFSDRDGGTDEIAALAVLHSSAQPHWSGSSNRQVHASHKRSLFEGEE